MATLINDLVLNVAYKVENRVQDTANIIRWLTNSLIELAGCEEGRDEFDALEVWGATKALSVGVAEYDVANFMPTANDLNLATLSFKIWIDPPTNSKTQPIRYTSYQEIDRYANVGNGLPQLCYRFGGKFGFFQTPDQTYQVQARVLKYHPIATPAESTEILLPVTWFEILEWVAAMRGFAELEEFEKSDSIHKLLYGDPEHPGKPGLIKKIDKSRDKEFWRRESMLRPVVRPYGFGSGGRT